MMTASHRLGRSAVIRPGPRGRTTGRARAVEQKAAGTLDLRRRHSPSGLRVLAVGGPLACLAIHAVNEEFGARGGRVQPPVGWASSLPATRRSTRSAARSNMCGDEPPANGAPTTGISNLHQRPECVSAHDRYARARTIRKVPRSRQGPRSCAIRRSRYETSATQAAKMVAATLDPGLTDDAQERGGERRRIDATKYTER
jgi:hypothetical protein